MDSDFIPNHESHNDASQDVEQTARLNRITSLRGAGVPAKIPTVAFQCIPVKLSDDERWTNSVLCSGFSAAMAHASTESTFESFLERAVEGFAQAFRKASTEDYHEMHCSTSSLFNSENKLHEFYMRRAPEPLRGVGRVSRRQPSKTVIVVDDSQPMPKKGSKQGKNLVDSSVATWSTHMELQAQKQNSSLDDLRRSQTVSTRQNDDLSLLNAARESEYNELRRLEAVAQKHEEKKDMRKRERE